MTRRPTIRTPALLAVSALALTLTAPPAWAGATFTGPAEQPADSDVRLELLITEEQEVGRTETVTVAVPAGFTAIACSGIGWDCDVAPPGMIFRRTAVGQLYTSSLTLDVHTATINGTYPFRVTQDDATGGKRVHSSASVTIVGGQDPEPEPTQGPAPGDGGGGQGDATGDASSDDGEQDQAAADDLATGGGERGDAQADGGDRATSDRTTAGSTAPRRSQGRSAGTTLEITPGRTDPAAGGQPDAAALDTADEPAVADPGGDGARADTTTVAASGGDTEGQPGAAVPWQQWVGAAMLLVGVAVLAGRRWGDTALAGLRGIGDRAVVARVRTAGRTALDRLGGRRVR